VYQTVVVDGLFIAVHKERIKKPFNEEFNGFHFYDIPFCFENHLEGVKVGVITNIRMTHKSIGETNQQWEENRQIFQEKYQNNLPLKLPIDPNKRLKVLALGFIKIESRKSASLSSISLKASLIELVKNVSTKRNNVKTMNSVINKILAAISI
jgi:hypothetical protein